METLWENRFAQRTQRMTSSTIRELLKLTEKPGLISFAGGLPAPEVFPVEQIAAACTRALREQGTYALQYSTTEGYNPLREFLMQYAARDGLTTSLDNILITSGSQQALDLLGKVIINRGDHILVESPTYLGALQAWNAYGAEYVTVDSDEYGMRTDALEEALRAGPKFIYVLPTFQNPTGVTLTLERRRALLELAARYGVPIVEDDPYSQLRFEGEHLPALIALDGQARGDSVYQGNVIYLSTFSKILAPGLRLAWIIAPPAVMRKLVQAKQGADLHTATFNQIVAYQVARDGFIDAHIQTIQRVYRERRDTMLAAMEEQFPPTVRWTHPQGGLFLWGTLPEEFDSSEVFIAAVKKLVAFVPGAPFFPCGGGNNTMRLNFSYAKPEIIREGILRLGHVLRAQMEEKVTA